MFKLLIPQDLIETYKRNYGLRLSSEAANELYENFIRKSSEVASLESKKLDEMFEKKECDILLFKQILKPQNQAQLSEILAHEFWHIIERDLGIISKNPLMREGCANYVKHHLFGTDIQWGEDFHSIVYDNSAYIIKKIVEGKPCNPLYTLLVPHNRKVITQFIEEELYPDLKKLVINLIQTQTSNKDFLRFKEFEQFKENSTIENLLQCYRDFGLNKFAEEIKGQNLQKFHLSHIR